MARTASYSPSPRRRSRTPVRPRRKQAVVATPASPPDAHIESEPTEHYEFMGPPGAAAMTAGLPVAVVAFVIMCTPDSCPLLAAPSVSMSDALNPTAFAVVLAWFGFQALLHVALPGPSVKGTILADGSQLTYNLNGFRCLVVSLYLVGVAHVNGIIDLLWLADNFLSVAVAASVLSFALSVYLYRSSFGGDKLLAAGGQTGSTVYDFFIGRELNPRWGSFDWKFVCELRPGLIGWAVLNFAFVAKEAQDKGAASTAMLLVVAFQLYYVIDALWNEGAILTTMDITTDGFGYMLVFGDLVWVPFMYSLQARYLSMYSPELSVTGLAAIFMLHTVGLWMFRGANSQKNTFRTQPDHLSVRDLEYVQTKRGTRLLASSWWGMARHINYLGDWLMGVAWCLPCGFGSPIPYFYAVYFAILLVHRERRDDAKCSAKYGADWEEYCRRVPHRIIPYVY